MSDQMNETVYRIYWKTGGTLDVKCNLIEADDGHIYLKDEAGFILHVVVSEMVGGVVRVNKIA